MRKEFVKRLLKKGDSEEGFLPLEAEGEGLPLRVVEEGGQEELAPEKGTPSPQPSPEEARRRQTQVLRRRIRLLALEALAEERVEAGLLLALAAGILPLRGLSRLEAALKRGLEAGLAQAALELLSLPTSFKRKGSWPGGKGWPFLEPVLDQAVEAESARLTLEVSKATLGAPLFLAALLPLAVEVWGVADPRTERVAALINGRLVPLLKYLTLERVLDRRP